MLVTLGLGVPRTRGNHKSWLPLDINSLIGWYDAADAASIDATAGQVNALFDKSGHGNHLSAGPSVRPDTGLDAINGLNVLSFSTQCLSLTGYTDGAALPAMAKTNCAIAFVFKQPADSDTAPIYIKSTSSGDMISPNYSTLDRIYVPGPGTTGSVYASPSPAVNGGVYSMLVNFNTVTGIQAYINNALALDHATGVSSNSFDRFIIGARPYNGAFWSGQIAEICIFSAMLDESERLALLTYLAAKWGL